MNKCILCGVEHSILRPNSTIIPAKYCSKKCIKRASYYRKNPMKRSYLRNDEFWKTETGIGFRWEKWIADKIGAKHVEFNIGGCDLEMDGQLIDVKACNLWRRKHKRGVPVKSEQSGVWVFNRNKQKKCDWFYCVCLDGGSVVKVYKIPSDIFSKSGITIGNKSKYDEYLVTL